jgi:hypothetical protein
MDENLVAYYKSLLAKGLPLPGLRCCVLLKELKSQSSVSSVEKPTQFFSQDLIESQEIVSPPPKVPSLSLFDNINEITDFIENDINK